jgi:hypothetical protein
MKPTAFFPALIVVALVMGGNASAAQFKKARYYSAGQRPYQSVTADFNNDGNTDLAMADWLSSQLVVLLGNGDGTFQKTKTISVGAPGALAVGDFNEDGNLDLAIVQENGNADGVLVLYLGDGKGGFKEASTYPTGAVPTSMAVADVNGDGHMDVLVTDRGSDGSGDVLVFSGTGKGKLRPAKKYSLTGSPFRVAVEDLNGDHFPDLAVTQFDNGTVAIFLNDGTGKFRKPVTYDAGGYGVVGVVAADLRNSGKQDLAISNEGAGMVVLLNNGDGTFGKPSIYLPNCSECQAPLACVVADFNLDNNLDVACVADYGKAYLFYGDGKGGFPKQIGFNETIGNVGGFSLAVGDFNNDKVPDLAIPLERKGKVAIMLNAK